MLLASVLNINSGNALSATQLLFVTFLIGIFPALAISADTPEAGTMDRPPRDSSVPILNSSTLPRWLLFGVVQGGIGIFAFWLTMRQGESVQVVVTRMVFAVMGWSTVLIAAGLRRDVTPIWNGPYLPYFLWLAVPLGLTWLAVESELLQPSLDTVSIFWRRNVVAGACACTGTAGDNRGGQVRAAIAVTVVPVWRLGP